MQAMFCTQCGTKLDDAARFCVSCGKPTSGAASGPAASDPASGPMETPSTPPYAGASYANGAAAAPPKRLRKVVAQKKISGVCAGFAEFFDIDITLMRIIWVALLLLPPHLGVIAYIVCIFVLPKG